MDLYLDEKWKLSKKGSFKAYSSSSKREQSTAASSAASGPCLKRSSSMPEAAGKGFRRRGSAATSASSTHRSFTRRCANLVKEQRAKFYIMRRCVIMLICWRDYP